MRVSTARTMGFALGHHAAQRLAGGVLGPQPGVGPAPARLGACGLRIARSGTPDAVAPAPRADGPPRLRSLRVSTASGWPRMALGWGVPPVARQSGPRAPPPGPAGPPPSHPARLGAAPATGPGRHVAAVRPLRIGGARAGPTARPLSRLRPPGALWAPLGPCWARACRNGHSRAVKAADAPPTAVARWASLDRPLAGRPVAALVAPRGPAL